MKVVQIGKKALFVALMAGAEEALANYSPQIVCSIKLHSI